ncbi:MAG: shikimate dehydrogenase, partial [Aestuariivirga sp.]
AGSKHITVVNRDPKRGQTLVDLLNSKTKSKAELAVWNKTYSVPAGADIVVNATSIGLYPDMNARLDINLDTLRKGLVVADVIPNPPRTNLIRDAEARGCKTVNGLGMLVNQGVIGVKYWTGVDVDPNVMKNKLEEIFSA